MLDLKGFLDRCSGRIVRCRVIIGSIFYGISGSDYIHGSWWASTQTENGVIVMGKHRWPYHSQESG